MNTFQMPLTDIRVPDRLREVDPEWVDALATDMRAKGFTSHLMVRPARDVTKGNKWGKEHEGLYDLVAGGHRLAAAREAGFDSAPVILVDPNTPDEALLLEIDENLLRHELNPLDRAVSLARRKEIWERLYPETKQHAAGGHAKAGSASDTMSFAKSTAERLGISPKTIERAVRIANRIPAELRRRIARERLIDKQAELLALADLEPGLQGAVVERLSAGSAKSVADAIASIDGRRTDPADPAAQQLRKLQDGWTRAAQPVRRRFIEQLLAEGEIPAEWLEALAQEKAA
ncbi:MAG: ParB N-terminal domain-containing protein [Tistlia sp.]|uniref:ParB/RepB/Spo0J family partition protein n=1 Tax=Tistlia sp. TaxID=3057121 RepID=UPI0034A2D50C